MSSPIIGWAGHRGLRYGPAMDDEDGYFPERVAATYDDSSDGMFDPGFADTVAEALAGLAGGGRALELGIGTGRIALPLARRGVEVHGIDLSRAMVARLRAKPGGDAIGVTIGDFATTRADGAFRIAYLVFNTISNLTTQDAQVACFRNAAAHLEPGGCFVIEVGVPELRRLPPGQTVLPWQMTPTRWAFDSYDMATQAMSSNYLTVENGRGEYRSIPFRYAWPSELDLMAQIAGCACATGGRTGTGSPSPARAASTSRSGKRSRNGRAPHCPSSASASPGRPASLPARRAAGWSRP
jgi:SAM-dependent methyltransferase